MLIIKRRIGDTISIDPSVTITVLGTDEDQVVLSLKRVNCANKEQDSDGSDHTPESVATGLN